MDDELRQRVERLYEKYKDNVYSYVYSRVFDKNAVEDIVHDIFVKVVAKINTYDEQKASQSTWLYVITRNTVLDYYKTKHVHCPIEELDESIVSDINVDARVEENERNGKLMEALDKLKPIERDIVVLRYFYGYRSTEIAAMLNMTHGHVRIMCMRTLQKLSKILGGGVRISILLISLLPRGYYIQTLLNDIKIHRKGERFCALPFIKKWKKYMMNTVFYKIIAF